MLLGWGSKKAGNVAQQFLSHQPPEETCVMDTSRAALLDLSCWVIQLFRYCNKMHSVRKPGTTSSARCSDFHAPPLPPSLSYSSPFPPSTVISFIPPSGIPWVKTAGSGQAVGGGHQRWVFLCPCRGSDHPSLSEPSISGTHSALLLHSHQRLCLTGTSVLNGAFTQYWLAPHVSLLAMLGKWEAFYHIFSFSIVWSVDAGEWKDD